jgi:hypothetical protein
VRALYIDAFIIDMSSFSDSFFTATPPTTAM